MADFSKRPQCVSWEQMFPQASAGSEPLLGAGVVLGDPGVSQNLEKILLYVQYKTGTYTLIETVKSTHKKIALTLESVQYEDSHLQSDHLFGTLSAQPLSHSTIHKRIARPHPLAVYSIYVSKYLRGENLLESFQYVWGSHFLISSAMELRRAKLALKN